MIDYRTPEERLAALEERVRHLDETLEHAIKKIDDMHDIFMQARGVRWAIVVTATIIGFITGILPWLYHRM